MNAPTTHQLHVKGMSCQHCVRSVTQAVQSLDASAQVHVELPAGLVNVTSQLSREAVAAAIADEGYEVLAD